VSRRRLGSERGAATVDFVLVGTLVTLMFLALVQLGIDYHVRNVLAASVAEGARYGANADIDSAQAGADKANELITSALGARFAVAAPDNATTNSGGLPLVAVTVRVRLPLFAWFLPDGPMVSATGHAVREAAG
jgi:Flp pilus assembly protein TadG